MNEGKKQILRHRKYFSFILILLTICMLLPATAVKTEAAANGFRVENGNTYYYKNGKKYKGWLTLNGKKYYFYSSTGKMATGWTKNTKGQKRYFDLKTGVMKTGWMKESTGKKRYFYKSTGIMATGWVTNSQGIKRYFYNGNGYMATGWVKKSNGTARYFDPSNGNMLTGFQKIGSYYYYFNTKNGLRFQNGFKKISSTTYYFNTTNGRAKTGWLTLNGKKYYFNKNGAMYAGTALTLDGKRYIFDQNGVATESTANLSYTISGDNVIISDPNGKKYPLVKEYLEHPGVADGTVSDLELLAAISECEAGNQGLVGMEAVALCILNRTIAPTKEFPSTVRGVIYHGGSFPQYSVVRNNTLIRRLNGKWDDKELAFKAASNAMKMIDDYLTKGTPRTLEGFKKKDFDYMYFMMESAFWAQPLDFDKVEYFLYVSPIQDTHMFFVDWVSPSYR